MPFVSHVLNLMRLPYFEARIVFGNTPVAHGDRKTLAQALHAAVSRARDGEAW